MDSGFRTPLVDFFRRGEVAPDIRMLAAQGALAPRAQEQLALLVLLAVDPDPTIRAEAERTIARIPSDALRSFLARTDVPSELRQVFAERGVQPAAAADTSSDEPLVTAEGDEASGTDETGSEDDAAGGGGEGERQGTVQKIANMSIAARVKCAMRGSREERAVLIRDANKLVSLAVLSSPKVTETEVESFAKMGSISEEVLRVIGTSRTWTKNYGVISGLARNPKTPLAISLGLLKRLNERDIKMLTTDRNVPEVLRLAARKNLVSSQSRRE